MWKLEASPKDCDPIVHDDVVVTQELLMGTTGGVEDTLVARDRNGGVVRALQLGRYSTTFSFIETGIEVEGNGGIIDRPGSFMAPTGPVERFYGDSYGEIWSLTVVSPEPTVFAQNTSIRS